MKNSRGESETNGRTMRWETTKSLNPNGGRLVFWDGTVDAIKQLLVLILNRLSSYVTLGSGTRESAALNDDDVFGGGDALVDISARVELPRSPDDFLLELLGVHDTFL